MKQIIDGIRYDTDKAVKLGEFSVGDKGDMRYWHAGLYRTPRSGRYFLAGRGGAMSRFAKPCGDMTGPGSGIQPISEEEALRLAEDSWTVDEVERVFDHLIDDA